MSDKDETLDEGLDYVESSAVLSFDEIFPTERPTFRQKDGSELTFQVIQDIDDEEFTKIQRCQRLIAGSLKRLENNPEDEAARKRLGSISEDYVRLILPDINSVMLRGLKLGQKLKIINFWSSHAGFGETDEEKKGGGGRNKNS